MINCLCLRLLKMDSITATSLYSIFKSIVQSFNTLLDCPVQFSGEYNGQKVHNFVEYIEYYKRIKCIKDEQALQELQYLLKDEAHIWWIRKKSHLTTWAEALTILENQYSKQGPADMMLNEIHKHSNVRILSSEAVIVDELRNRDELYAMSSTQRLFQENYKEPGNMANIATSNILTSNIGSPVTETFEADGIPKSVLDQLIAMIKLGPRKNRKLRFELKLPDNGSYKVTLRRSGRNTIKCITQCKTSEYDLTKNITEYKSCNEQQSKVQNINAEINNYEKNEILNTNERKPTIKVRRSQDLMPEIKEEEEFISNDVESRIINYPHGGEENVQTDSEIMSQINNIINESEMNMQTLDHNQHFPTIISQLPNGPIISSLYNTETTIQSDTLTKKSITSQSKIHATIKEKKRGSLCRFTGHNYDTCLKKTKQRKLNPEHAKNTTCIMKSEFLSETEMNCSMSENDSNKPSLNCTNNLTTTLITTPTVTNISSILNNIPKKCMNSILTTKSTDSHTGYPPNKIMATTTRTTNNFMPKCHQCGAVGFYKSICPNCSPIYNSQNKQ